MPSRSHNRRQKRLSRRRYARSHKRSRTRSNHRSPLKRNRRYRATDVGDKDTILPSGETVSNWNALAQPIIECINEFVSLLYSKNVNEPSVGTHFERSFDVTFTVPHSGEVTISFNLYVRKQARPDTGNGLMHDVTIKYGNGNLLNNGNFNLRIESDTPTKIMELYKTQLSENQFSDNAYKKITGG